MGKSKSKAKETFFYCNILILIGLVGLYYYLSNKPVKEGIRDMNCCGGIERGIHYKETDIDPPSYVRRCFKDNEWNGMPCTREGDSKCCPSDTGNGGECIPTTKGGYCKSDDEADFYYRGSNKKNYLQYSNDEQLDINDANDMEDYFYERGDKKKKRKMTPEMRRFVERRTKNEEYIEKHLRDKRKSEQADTLKSKNKMIEQNKTIEIISSISIIHLIFLVVFSIVIREEIIHKIDGFYQLLYMKYLSFIGRGGE